MSGPATFHPAPWGKLLLIVSVLATLFCVGLAVATAALAPRQVAWVSWLTLLLPLACVPFVVRGYTVEGRTLVIRRLGWQTRLSLAGLTEARHDPDALRRSIRLCGNGGFYSFTGWYRNKVLGKFRAFVTDPARAVVLRLEQRVVVISPADPGALLRELETLEPR